MSSTCFETEGSSLERRFNYRTYSSTYWTAYTHTCTTYCTIPAYTTVFLKMDTRVRNM